MMGGSSLGFLGILAIVLIALLGTIFWLWMLADCATKESNQERSKIVWLIVIALTHEVGALIYFFARRLRRPAPNAPAPGPRPSA